MTEPPRTPLWVRALACLLPVRYREEILDDLLDERLGQTVRGRSRIGSGLWLAGHIMLSSVASRRPRGAVTIPDGPEARGVRAMPRLLHDLRLALRGFSAAKSHTAIAVLTLGLGLGINTAVFSILDSLLLRPVPFAEAERLVSLWTYYAPGKFTMKGGFSAPLVEAWRTQTDLFDRVEASETRSFVFEDPQGAEMVAGSLVTPGLLPMLGVPPTAGRLFTDVDGRDGSDRQVIVSERFWRSQLKRAPEVIGRPILLDGERYDIVGVMPAAFRFPDETPQLWIPFDVTHPPTRPGTPPRSFVATARIQRSVSRSQAEERVIARGADLNRAAGGDGQGSARVMMMGELFNERTERSLVVLGGAVLFLLLIVCVNVANLTLSRSLTRERDLAVRAALGASRRDLLREVLAECGLLGAAGAMLAVIVGQLAIIGTVAVLPEAMTQASLNAVDLDGRALAFLLIAGVLTVGLCGLPPAMISSRATVAEALRRDSRASVGSAASRRVRSVLVIAEVALSMVLLVGAALMTRSLLKLQAIDVGLDTDGLVALQVALPASTYTDPARREVFTSDLLERLRHDPDISNVSAGTVPPDETMIVVGSVEFSDRPGERTKSTLLPVYATWPGFFATTGIRLLEGRDFRPAEIEDVAIVSAGFAATYFPGRSPIGARFQVGKAPWRTIVGVASEVRRLSEDSDAREFEVYFPHDRTAGVMTAGRPMSRIAEFRTFVVRAAAIGTVVKRLPAVVHAIDSKVVISRTDLVAHQFADAIARPRVVFLMMAIFAGFGLVLATAGLYGVLSQVVSQRMREIGVRLALGARPRDVGALILRNGLSLTAIGLLIGLAAALGLVRVMQSLLYQVEPTDPVSVGIVSMVLCGSAVLACCRPAVRAMRADPVRLLRED